MNWLLRAFNQKRSKISQPPSDEKKQDFTAIVHVVVEETIMAGALWLIGVTKQMLDEKITPSEKAVEPPVEPSVESSISDSLPAVEELTAKVSILIEQLYDRTSSLLALERRFSSLEQSLTDSTVVNGSNDRSDSAKDVSQELNSLIQQLQQEIQRINSLEHRINHLEKLLTKYSVIPKFIGQHHREIITLQNRITELETSHKNNHHTPVLQFSSLDN